MSIELNDIFVYGGAGGVVLVFLFLSWRFVNNSRTTKNSHNKVSRTTGDVIIGNNNKNKDK